MAQTARAMLILGAACIAASAQGQSQPAQVQNQTAQGPDRASQGQSPTAQGQNLPPQEQTQTVQGQSPPVQAKVQAHAIATNNGAGQSNGNERADLILSLDPSIRLTHRAANLDLQAEFGASLRTSVNDTRPNRAFPIVRSGLKSTLVDRLLFLDASADVSQSEVDPYGLRGTEGATDNLRTNSIYRLSPRVEYEVSSRVGFTAKFDETLTKYTGDSAANLETRQALVRLEGRPEPLGFSLELSRFDTVYDQSDMGGWTIDGARASADFAFDGQFIVGLLGGAERSKFVLSQHTDTVAGFRFRWVPDARTELNSTFERRFFGNGWNASFRHRMPSLAFSIRTSREPVTSTGSLGAAAEGQNLTQFLDAILTTRFPDPVQRAALVQSLITSRGLQTTLASAINVLADYAQLRTGGDVSIVYLSPRDTVSLSFFAQSVRQLSRADGADILQSAISADSKQYGSQIEANRRLTPDSTLTLALRWARIDGLGLRKNDSTRDTSYQLTWTRSLSPRTDVSLGALNRRMKTNVANGTSSNEYALLVGMTHRF